MIFRKHKITTLGIGLFLIYCSMAMMCNSATDVHKAAVAANDIQTTVDTATDTTAQLFHDGILPKAKAHAVALILQKVNGANQILINTARSMNSDSSTNRCILAGQLLNIANAVKELQDAGLLGIKSKAGVLVFDTALSSLIADIKIVAAIIGQCATPATKVVINLEIKMKGLEA